MALRCAASGAKVTVVTKAHLDDGSTRWAQGGIAAALGDGDTPEQHLDDTLVAGAGLCDEAAVRALVTEGPDAVRRLIATGARFDTDAASGAMLLTREGGHHRRRIAHAGGDATGAEISRALIEAVREAGVPGRRPGIEFVENALVLDLLTDAEGRTAGVTLHVMGEGQRDGVGAVHARAVVLATGGMGQVFSATTNPAVSTGDGVALALRAGAEVSDLEFVQFHPTVLWLGPDAEGQQPLVSEAVRGEGAHLVDADGVRFMVGRHELAELAPRDIVAKGIMRRMQETGAEHMYLDARHFGAAMWAERFPTILAACRAHGIDPVTEPIPVAPAAHYASGGVRTDLRGRTTVPGPLRVRRGRLHRRARRQPARVQLPAGRPGLRRADRRRHRRRPGRARRAGRARARAHPAAGPRGPLRGAAHHDRGRRRAAQRGEPGHRGGRAGAAAHRGRRGARQGRQDRRALRGDLGGDQPRVWSPGCWSPPPGAARRPAAATGARTAPTATTSTGAATRRTPHPAPHARGPHHGDRGLPADPRRRRDRG